MGTAFALWFQASADGWGTGRASLVPSGPDAGRLSALWRTKTGLPSAAGTWGLPGTSIRHPGRDRYHLWPFLSGQPDAFQPGGPPFVRTAGPAAAGRNHRRPAGNPSAAPACSGGGAPSSAGAAAIAITVEPGFISMVNFPHLLSMAGKAVYIFCKSAWTKDGKILLTA